MSLQKNRKYKATIILDSRGYDAPVETLEEKISGLFKEVGGDVESVENIGRQEFVRVTEKDHTGDTYLQVKVSGAPTMPGDFQERIRLDKQVKRALIEVA
jgi:small subunit ribosomal protein S6